MATTHAARPQTAPSPVPLRKSWLQLFAWLSFLFETTIIGTGGAVRLTGSGLGCSEWPLCTPESLVPTQDLGIHGFIEFGNRTMTGVVGIAAIVVLLLTLAAVGTRRHVLTAVWFALGGVVAAAIAFALVGEFWAAAAVLLVVVIVAAIVSVRSIPQRRDLQILAWIVVAGVVAQALAGGITVLTELNAFLVGFHYAASLALVCVTAAFLVRLYDVPGPRERAVPTWFLALTHVTTLVLAVTVFFGVLTTANGPHSGDPDIVRDGFDATVLAHVHSWPGYLLLGLVVVLTVVAAARRLRPLPWLIALLAVILVQVVVGVIQARNGLPELLVGIHMVLAALSAAAFTVVVLRLKRPAAVQA
ncbi:COX15/CtaA family protein [Microbacterium sediminis]|uniref:Cytochrome oxidase assembly protein n=1 Tax=Microbacterium sediminis TaxID=904291 RepID=A0A1B9N940_9MICO|nr:COX15/CtaA family protein [Microbacterium sediminis]OCG73131.1 cytochrome oxidase assembly protein [Microbacterium sediminis]